MMHQTRSAFSFPVPCPSLPTERWLWLLSVVAIVFSAPAATAQPLFLADPASTPHVEVRWPTSEPDAPVVLSGDRPYAHDAERTTLGENVSAFVAVGGSRMRMGAGHPRAVSVKVGLYKIDPIEPFFRDLPPGAPVTIVLSNLRFNDDPAVRADSPLQHLKYDEGELQSCGISSTARNQYNIYSPTDPLNARIRPGIDTRPGALDGSAPTDGLVTLAVLPDNTVTMTARVPYWLFRHLSDPWRTDIPGTFIEPYHFHIEFEVIPASVAEDERIEATPPPTDSDPETPEAEPATPADDAGPAPDQDDAEQD